MCPPGYYQNGFVATQELGHMMYLMYIEVLHCIYKNLLAKFYYPPHSCDYLKKISIKINVATDEGDTRNEIWR